MFSTYKPEDVTILLKDITGMVEPQSTEEREKLIQSGRHYCEMLPIEYSTAQAYIYKADTLIVAGTSLTVEPASGLVKIFNGKNLIIINNDKTPYDTLATLVIHDSLKNVIGKIFDKN